MQLATLCPARRTIATLIRTQTKHRGMGAAELSDAMLMPCYWPSLTCRSTCCWTPRRTRCRAATALASTGTAPPPGDTRVPLAAASTLSTPGRTARGATSPPGSAAIAQGWTLSVAALGRAAPPGTRGPRATSKQAPAGAAAVPGGGDRGSAQVAGAGRAAARHHGCALTHAAIHFHAPVHSVPFLNH